MKKFICEVIKKDKYEIEIDEQKMDREWMDKFKENFYEFDTLEEHAMHIATLRSRFVDDFMDGYGYPLVNGELVSLDHPNPNINIKIISEDEDFEVKISKP